MALRDDPRISLALRERVRKVALEEGYLGSTLAQSLVSGWTGLIGVVVPNVVSTLMARLIQGIIDELSQDDLIPLVLCSELDVDRAFQPAGDQHPGRQAPRGCLPPCHEGGGPETCDPSRCRPPIASGPIQAVGGSGRGGLWQHTDYPAQCECRVGCASAVASTVEQHPRKTGAASVQVLKQMIAGKPVPRTTLIKPELIVRESSTMLCK